MDLEFKTIIMNLGKRYAVTYITEIGLIMSVGYLKVISDSVPDECTKYIGSNMSIASTAYIGLDCSTEGNSDKKKICQHTISAYYGFHSASLSPSYSSKGQ